METGARTPRGTSILEAADMKPEEKISPAFEPFMADSGRDDIREAIVMYLPPEPVGAPVRGRLRAPQMRLDYVKDLAARQQPIEEQLLRSYREEGSKRLPGDRQLEVSTIAESTLPVAKVDVTRRTLRDLSERPDVVAIMPNQQIRLIEPRVVNYDELAKQEKRSGLTWGLEKLDIPKMWETTKGEQISVAVLDTGVYGDHEALAGRVKEFVLFDPLGREITALPSFDSGQHGTHGCGTIAGGKTPDGVCIGVAPGVNLLVAGVLVGGATLLTLMQGIAWGVRKGADIINMSLGFSYYEPKFAEILQILVDVYGVLPVVAIGNENHGNSSSPGNAYSALSIGAVEKMPYPFRRVSVAFFSGGASLVFPGQEPHGLVTKPDVVAPGVQIYSCIPPENRADGTYKYSYMHGTSMATPHVAGAAALLMAARPEAPITDIIQVLKETADHPDGDPYRPDNRWGYGLIQPVEALNALS
jgi:subtilisin family serine protease